MVVAVVAQSLRVEIDVAKTRQKPSTNGKCYTLSQANKQIARKKKTIIESIPKRQKEAPRTQWTDKKVFPVFFSFFSFFCQAIWNVENKNPASIFALVCLNERREYWQLWNFKWKSTCETFNVLSFVATAMVFFFQNENIFKKKSRKLFYENEFCVNVDPSADRHQCGAMSSVQAQLESAVNLNR